MRNPRSSVPRLATLVVAAAVGLGASPAPWRLSAGGAARARFRHRRLPAGPSVVPRLRRPGRARQRHARPRHRGGVRCRPVPACRPRRRSATTGTSRPRREWWPPRAPKDSGSRSTSPDTAAEIPPEAFQMTAVEAVSLDGVEWLKDAEKPVGRGSTRWRGARWSPRSRRHPCRPGTPGGPARTPALVARPGCRTSGPDRRDLLAASVTDRLLRSAGAGGAAVSVSLTRSHGRDRVRRSRPPVRRPARGPGRRALTLQVPEPRRQPVPCATSPGCCAAPTPRSRERTCW